MTNFPKVLIIGQSFNKKSGGGITLSNLFKSWPSENIGFALNDYIGQEMKLYKNIYRLGNKESKRKWPFSIIQNKIISGPININSSNESYYESESLVSLKEKISVYNKLNLLFRQLLHFFGIYYFIYKLEVSKDFLEWIKEFHPDIIYSQLSTLELIRFVSQLQQTSTIPVAIHIMDDWIETIVKPGILSVYWRKIIRKEFQDLINKSNVLMGISEAMCEEYKKRYGKTFLAFHNPVELENWLEYSKTNWTVKETFTILYAGRLGIGTYNSVLDIADVVEKLYKEKYSVKFEVQTDSNDNIIAKLKEYNCVSINSPIEYQELPQKFSTVDLLVLPIDFDFKSIRFLKYSMPTKTSEYMISGTPVLIYSPKETALYKYGEQNKWAYLVGERNIDLLYQSIKEIYHNENLRKDLGEIAKKIAIENHDAVIVREKFRNALCTNQN